MMNHTWKSAALEVLRSLNRETRAEDILHEIEIRKLRSISGRTPLLTLRTVMYRSSTKEYSYQSSDIFFYQKEDDYWGLVEWSNRQPSFREHKSSNSVSALYKQSPLPSQKKDLKTLSAADLNKPAETSRIQYTVYRILRDTALAREVKHLHDYKCQLCGEAIQLSEGLFYAEAHHIKPLGTPHHGPDILENILCVCPNHHALLDYGAIKLNEAELIMCTQHKVSSEYIHYHNTSIVLSNKPVQMTDE